MWKNSGKISLYIGMLAGFVVTLQAFQGTFKTFLPGKLIRISKSSQIFLSKVVPLEQELFATMTRFSPKISHHEQQRLLALLQLSRLWSKDDTMQGSDVDRFGQLISWPQGAALPESNIALYRQSQSVVQEIAKIIALEIKQVHIATASVDLEYVHSFLQQLQNNNPTAPSKQTVIKVFGIVTDIMHYFDAVSVTEYDFMVLSQTALCMQLLSFLV